MDFRLDGSIFVGSLAHPKARKHNKPPLRLCRGGVFHCGIDRPVCEGHADIHCCNHCGIHAPASGSQNWSERDVCTLRDRRAALSDRHCRIRLYTARYSALRWLRHTPLHRTLRDVR